MITFPTSVARPLAGGAFTILLALGAATTHAQVVPKPAPPMAPAPKNVSYYVDGKPTTEAELKAMDPNSIMSIDVIKDAAQKKALGQEASDGVALVTTKSGATSPEVVAFNKRFPLTPGTPAQAAATEAVKAYITQHYPAAKLESIMTVKSKTDRYNATFTNEGKRVYLLFDGQGNPVER